MELVKRTRFTEELRRELAKLYFEGYTAESIAEKYKLSTSFVYAAARKHPELDTAAEPVKKRKSRAPGKLSLEDFVKQIKSGFTPTNIIGLAQVSKTHVYQLRAEAIEKGLIDPEKDIKKSKPNTAPKPVAQAKPEVTISESLRLRILQMWHDDYYNAQTIRAELNLPDTDCVRRIVRDDKGAYKKLLASAKPTSLLLITNEQDSKEEASASGRD